MAQYLNKSKKITIFTMLAGALLVSGVATMQFVFVVKTEIQPQNYIVPITVGSILGLIIAYWYNKLLRARNKLHESHERLKFVLDGTGVGIWEWNPQTGDVHFDAGWLRILGFEADELLQTLSTWEDRVHPDDLDQVYQDMEDHFEGKTAFFKNVHRMKHKDGHWLYILDNGRVLERNEAGQPTKVIGTHSDISHLKEVEKELEISNQQLQKLSLLDGLTGLKNRRALDEFLDQQWGHWQRNQTPFSILMIDIDYFKQYNDRYGHLAGDDCLKQVADTLKQITKRTNDIAVRYGGEEFLVLLSGIEEEAAKKIARVLNQQIQDLAIPHTDSACSSHVTVSIGISSCDQLHACNDFLTPIDLADQALYLAKKRGRNQVAVAQKSA